MQRLILNPQRRDEETEEEAEQARDFGHRQILAVARFGVVAAGAQNMQPRRQAVNEDRQGAGAAIAGAGTGGTGQRR